MDLNTYVSAVYPNVVLELTAASSAELLLGLRSQKLDLAIGVNFSQITDKSLEYFKLFEDYYSFYVSPKNIDETEQLPLLIHESATDQKGIKVEATLYSKLRGRIVHRIQNFETLKSLTILGLGIGVMPTQVARPAIESQQLASVQFSKLAHLFGLHDIGFLATRNLLHSHSDFARDIYRLGEEWSKTK